MKKNIRIFFNAILLFYFVIIKWGFGIEYTPTKHQLYAFVFSVFLLITRMNNTNYPPINILKSITIKGEYIVYFSIFIQIIFILNNFDLNINLTEKISVASALCLLTYSIFNP